MMLSNQFGVLGSALGGGRVDWTLFGHPLRTLTGSVARKLAFSRFPFPRLLLAVFWRRLLEVGGVLGTLLEVFRGL